MNIDVNRRNEDGETPAHHAFNRGFRGFKIKWEDGIGKSIETSPVLPETVKVFLKYAKQVGIDFEVSDNVGKTPLHRMCLRNYEEDVRSFLTMAKEEYGIRFNLEATDKEGKRPLDICKDRKIVPKQ